MSSAVTGHTRPLLRPRRQIPVLHYAVALAVASSVIGGVALGAAWRPIEVIWGNYVDPDAPPLPTHPRDLPFPKGLRYPGDERQPQWKGAVPAQPARSTHSRISAIAESFGGKR